MDRGSLLHVGCGGGQLPEWMTGFKEVRADIDELCQPDIVASMTDLGDIGEFNAVYSSHCLEHLYDHEVIKALTEFIRVLKKGGFAMVFVPDLEDAKPTNDVLFVSPGGPVTGLDLMYGHRWQVARNQYMQHKTGFTQHTIKEAFEKAGFSKIEVQRHEPYNLMAIGVK